MNKSLVKYELNINKVFSSKNVRKNYLLPHDVVDFSFSHVNIRIKLALVDI